MRSDPTRAKWSWVMNSRPYQGGVTVARSVAAAKSTRSWTISSTRRTRSTIAAIKSPAPRSLAARSASLRTSAEDVIPERGADPEAVLRRLVMVEQVVALHELEEAPLHREVVLRVVEHVVGDV